MNIKNSVKKIIFRFHQIKKEKNPFFEKYNNLPECYILGSSPSLLNHDLKKLKNKPVLTLNNNFVHPDFNYFMKSEEVLKMHLVPPIHPPQSEEDWLRWFKKMEMNMPRNVTLFFGINNQEINTKYLIEKYSLFENHNYIFYKTFVPLNDLNKFFLNNFSVIPGCRVGSSLGLILLKFMRVKEIFMLGIDFNTLKYSKMQEYRFYGLSDHQKKEKIGKKYLRAISLNLTISEKLKIKKFNEEYSNIHNCSEESFLDMFEYKNF